MSKKVTSSDKLGISLNEKNEDPNKTRGTALQSHGNEMHSFAAPKQNLKGVASASRLDTDMPFEITLALDPKNLKSSVPTLRVVNAEPESKSDIPVSMDTNEWINDLNSHEIKGQSPEQVYKRLLSVMLEYSPELDISANAEQQCIDCVLFNNSSFEGLVFKLAVFEHLGSTRFELLRHDGSALSMAKLEGELKALICGGGGGGAEDEEKGGDADDPFSFIAMDLDVSGLAALPNLGSMAMSADELDDIHESLKCNDRHCVDDLYDLHTELVKETSTIQTVADHDQLMNTLIETATKHEDIAVVRACILVLETLCQDKDAAMLLMQQNAIYKRLSEMLGGPSMLARNYVVRLLATLSSRNWNMDSELAKEVESAVKQFHSEWKTSLSAESGLIEEKTFSAIFDKLSQFN